MIGFGLSNGNILTSILRFNSKFKYDEVNGEQIALIP